MTRGRPTEDAEMRRARRALKVVLGAALLGLLVPAASAASAQAAEPSPWWNLNTSIRPAVIPEGGEGVLVVRAANVGNGPTSGPASLSIELPAGVSVAEKEGKPLVRFFAFSRRSGEDDLTKEEFSGAPAELCSVATRHVICGTRSPLSSGVESISPLEPYEYLEIRATVKDEGAEPGAEFTAEASGGAAAPLARSAPMPIGPEAVKFGAEAYELRPEAQGGALDARAGAHPYQLTSTFNLDQVSEEEAPGSSGQQIAHAPALARNLAFRLPPGQIGNAVVMPQCSAVDFATLVSGSPNLCPPDTAIGVALITVDEPLQNAFTTFPVPLFNLQPAYGEPARFGFDVLGALVILNTSVRSAKAGIKEGDYGVTVSSRNITQLSNFISSTVTFWGVPGDRSHDNSRGWECLTDEYWLSNGHNEPPTRPCEPQKQENPPAFLTLPTECSSPFATDASGESWTDPQLHPVAETFGPFEGANPFALTACNQLPFDPHVHSEPTSDSATSPTGLSFDINFEDEGLTAAEGRAQSQLKKAVVTLPQGFTTNPSVAEGLKACTEAEYEAATLEANSGCTPESKVGEVTVESPLVQPNQIVKGGIYVARQRDNPNHNLLALYMIVREPEIGVLIRQALKVEANETTGQLTTVVDNVPQLPFSHFHLFFRPGQRAPLVTPPACGTYTVKALLYPWSNPEAPVERTSSFQITQGPEGQGCPSGGVPPFHPGLEAGTQNNAAGTYSPFYTHITRKDSEQEITRFSIKLPTGVIGKLAGVSECSDAQIAAAKAREKEGGGSEEESNPSCPANSEVGHSLVGSGVGNVLAYAPGKLYLAGPYHGSPISIVSITAAKVGPFDLGTVVVRFALNIDHETAEVSVDGVNSDPIPHIVDGIPVHLRDIRAYVDRPNFTLNPTSCAKKSTASTILGSGLDFVSAADDVPVTVSSPFQAADCASLGFKPSLKLSLSGKSHRGALPAFKAVLTYPKKGAYANIAKAQVTLPSSENLEQAHLEKVCPKSVFITGSTPGENCPASSIYGTARAFTPLLDEPLEGPVFLRTGYGTVLPELTATLNNKQIHIVLAGKIDSVGKKGSENTRIRNTFELVPDAPVSKFVLEMKGGNKGLLVNKTNICRGTHKALAAFTAQNGKLHEFQTVVKAKTCAKQAKKSRHG